VGVTADAVVLGNVSTLTTAGVPGVSGEDLAAAGARAVVAYQNSLGGIWGRRVTLDVRDDKGLADTNRDQTRALARSAYALVGSSSVVDDAGAGVLQATNVPDVTRALTQAREGLANNFSVAPNPSNTAVTTMFDWVTATNPAAASSVATLYLDDPELRDIHVAHMAAAAAAGWKLVYSRRVSVTETDYTADVVHMRQNGARTVYLVGMRPQDTQRLADAMHQQSYKPDLFIAEGPATILDPASAAVDGIISTSATALLDGQDDTRSAEARTFREWFNRTAPGRRPDEHAAMAWASGKLLFQAMANAGPGASRDQFLKALDRVDHFDANGLIADAGPGTKRPSTCVLITQIHDQRATRLDPPSGFRCGGREIRA
jgi:ABC-type branched-subunit amino acid transport system substrate-binding protein